MPNPATVVVTAENKLGQDQCFALLQVTEPRRVEEEKLSEQASQQTRIQESPSKRVLEEKLHETGQETVSMSEANELQKRSTDERLEEHAESRTQGSIEMGQLQTSTVTTERFEEKLVIKQQLIDQRAEQGQSAQFKTIIDNATNVQWSVNGQPVSATTPGIKATSSASEHELLIESAKESSTVKCEARNASDQVEQSAKLVVEPKGEPPVISQGPNSRTVSEHEVVSFNAIVTSKLRPLTVEWTLNGQVITPSSAEFGLSQSGDQFTLRVNDTSVSHTGQVKVTATNPGTFY